MMYRLLTFGCFLWASLLPAQTDVELKCSPTLLAYIQKSNIREQSAPQYPLFTVLVKNIADFEHWAYNSGLVIVSKHGPTGVVVFHDQTSHFLDTTLLRNDVLFADLGYLNAKAETSVPGHNLYANNIAWVHRSFPQLNGSETTISIKEYRFDSTDIEFYGRYVANSKSKPATDAHSTFMATLAAGAGNSNPAGRGVARGSKVFSSNFEGLLPDDDNDYADFNISAQNHSYGLGIENYYGAHALAYDQSVVNNPHLLHVFSAGNKGFETSTAGPYTGVEGYANMTGNFKMAKNILTVGAIDSFYNITPFSSRGPAFDGRIKPDLVAFGQDGTSNATALVSGSAAVVQQAFFERTGFWPTSDIVRAILLGSADDLGTPGPDFSSGFGNLNLKKAVDLAQNQDIGTGHVAQGETMAFTIEIPANTHWLKVTLCWIDPPALPNTASALSNDLDLKVQTPDGINRLPWAPNPHPDSLSEPARIGRDSLNNIEQVFFEFPVPGLYTVVVAGNKVFDNNQQAFAFSVCRDSSSHFTWTSPLAGNDAVLGKEAVLRWESTMGNQLGHCSWKYTGSNEWNTLDAETPLNTGYKKWLLPDTFASVQVRMQMDGRTFVSDTFLISPVLRLRTVYYCADSFMLRWNKTAPDAQYRLWNLGNFYLQPVLNTLDTVVVLNTDDYLLDRFAVSTWHPLSNAESNTSSAPDVSMNGAGCYINGFFANLNDQSEIDLMLNLGSVDGVQDIRFEKRSNGVWNGIHDVFSPNSLEITHTDDKPDRGTNTYRVTLVMDNGGKITSAEETVYYAGKSGFWVWPNPVQPGGSITLLANLTEETNTFVLYDWMGKRVMEMQVEDYPSILELPYLPPGYYVWVINDGTGSKAVKGKLLILK